MYTVTYYKFGNRWFLDFPDYVDKGVEEEDLERVGAFHEFLELIADGEDTVVLQMNGQPFDGADRFELIGSSGGTTGGYYRMTFYKGQPVDIELWFNTLLYITQIELPPKIYIKKVM